MSAKTKIVDYKVWEKIKNFGEFSSVLQKIFFKYKILGKMLRIKVAKRLIPSEIFYV